MIRKLVIFVSFLCVACQSRGVEKIILNGESKYSIQSPEGWDFFDYGFDGDVYENPSLEPSATLTYGKYLDAKITVFFIPKSNAGCVLKATTTHSYEETSNLITREVRKRVLEKKLYEWKGDHQTELVRIYFSANRDECVLFELFKRKSVDRAQVFEDFDKIVNSLRDANLRD